MKKKVFALVVFVMLGVFAISSFVIGDSAFGAVSLTILSPFLEIYIHYPEDATYSFDYNPDNEYLLGLNVSANSPVENWWYVLEDLRCDVSYNVGFSGETIPSASVNTTFNAVRGTNVLTVFGTDAAEREGNDSVMFEVDVPNHAPLLGQIDDEVFACEGSSLWEEFNATDVDGDELVFDISTPSSPFYVVADPMNAVPECNLMYAESAIYSINLRKSHVGTYPRTVSVTDGEYADSKSVDITVIEINNPPTMETIGVQTVWTQGENSTFEHQLGYDDVEDADEDLVLGLTFLDGEQFFDINGTGFMNFTGNESLIGVYLIEVCATDLGIPAGNRHENIEFCGMGDGSPTTTCQTFELTITDENRPPTIVNWYPEELEFVAAGETEIYFNVTEHDPDGTTPDTYWYVDDALIEYDNLSLYDEFIYSFECGVSGTHTARVDATDGELNDSLEWVVDVQRVDCPAPPAGGGGGGGGGTRRCEPRWSCNVWNVCQNVEQSLDAGILSGLDYRDSKDKCSVNFWDEVACGYQTKICFDVNACNVTTDKPELMQACHFSLDPSCSDKIKNCHDGDCEFLVDCGGPCSPCPTCSDRIQNQGEHGVDCGGPCPIECPPEVPKKSRVFYYVGGVLAVLLLVVLGIRVYKVLRLRREVGV